MNSGFKIALMSVFLTLQVSYAQAECDEMYWKCEYFNLALGVYDLLEVREYFELKIDAPVKPPKGAPPRQFLDYLEEKAIHEHAIRTFFELHHKSQEYYEKELVFYMHVKKILKDCDCDKVIKKEESK
jgi:hypothetical protein